MTFDYDTFNRFYNDETGDIPTEEEMKGIERFNQQVSAKMKEGYDYEQAFYLVESENKKK